MISVSSKMLHQEHNKFSEVREKSGKMKVEKKVALLDLVPTEACPADAWLLEMYQITWMRWRRITIAENTPV